MDDKKKKAISIFLMVIGTIIIILIAYFLIQCLRERFYQNAFDERYQEITLKENGIIDQVQVFHGVKLHTYVTEEDKPQKVIFEIKDEVKNELEGYEINSDGEGMEFYSEAIQYKQVKDKKTGKEQFIVSVRKSPGGESSPASFRTYTINENGVIKVSDFTMDTKSKLGTQWIRGISDETHGYYTNLPYQDGAIGSILFLSLIGLLLVASGLWLRRHDFKKGEDAAG
ncbi:hypothetical protein LCD52_22975 [Rossellomorea vietnamensis]|uniref:hypothetical protein n=1 Tax=Rossellomorea vietnamensis TaxID=218284 RepID=UPI001CCDA665|nr:hypothetical protein [Rossellomorea vietnamensis]MCA0151573.1 hypothetical protein [Rossellomorea vietnamensis]